MKISNNPVDVFEELDISGYGCDFPLKLLHPASDQHINLVYQTVFIERVITDYYLSLSLYPENDSHSKEQICTMLIEKLISTVPHDKKLNRIVKSDLLFYKNLRIKIPSGSCVYVTNKELKIASACILCCEEISIFEMRKDE